VGEAEFRKWVAEGRMLEHAHVFGNFYGSPMGPVSDAIEAGQDVLFDIDWQGAQQIANSALQNNVLSIFLLPPSITELHRRLVARAQDDPETIQRRVSKSWDEISHWDSYDYVLINDDLDATETRLKTIIEATRLRRSQQPAMVEHVRALQTEFEDL
jgi:guanylate kinase